MTDRDIKKSPAKPVATQTRTKAPHETSAGSCGSEGVDTIDSTAINAAIEGVDPEIIACG